MVALLFGASGSVCEELVAGAGQTLYAEPFGDPDRTAELVSGAFAIAALPDTWQLFAVAR